MNTHWTLGNHMQLLDNGEEFFPRVFAAIAAAQHEVMVETFILFEDKVGLQLHAALLQAAGRGAKVDLTVDGFGSPDLSPAFIGALTAAGVRIHVFDPAPRLWGWRTNMFRRMHRKIVVVDAARAFVGGINYSADHLLDYGPTAKQDYAVDIQGPIVAHIRGFAVRAIAAGQRQAQQVDHPHDALQRFPPLASPPAQAGQMAALFVTRDNGHHTNDIEKHYRIAIRGARQRVVIANAYFFPGYRLLREMRRAARRGVQVELILQGEPDMPIVKTAASLLYHHLLTAGVRIFEYRARPLHGKVAISDHEWSTVGSSNLDPLSLSLNLEANLIIRDRSFNQQLTLKLDQLMRQQCHEVLAEELQESNWWRVLRSFFVFHVLRRYPAWAGWLPAHQPRLTPAEKLFKTGADRLGG
jgi:cardiolipin synthase